MADIAARKAQLARDLDWLRGRLTKSRDAIKALPAGKDRTPAQRQEAKALKFEVVVARTVLNAISTPEDADLGDAD